MRAVWAAQAWQVGLTLRQARGEVRQFAALLLVVGLCQLRREHIVQPDICARLWSDEHGQNGIIHNWCPSCGWCETERERRPELVGVDCADRGQFFDEALP
jgi:hypothetical protein